MFFTKSGNRIRPLPGRDRAHSIIKGTEVPAEPFRERRRVPSSLTFEPGGRLRFGVHRGGLTTRPTPDPVKLHVHTGCCVEPSGFPGQSISRNCVSLNAAQFLETLQTGTSVRALRTALLLALRRALWRASRWLSTALMVRLFTRS